MINVKEEENIINYGLKDYCCITLIDQENIIGGNNILFNKI